MSPEKGTDELVVSMLTTSKTTVHSNTEQSTGVLAIRRGDALSVTGTFMDGI